MTQMVKTPGGTRVMAISQSVGEATVIGTHTAANTATSVQACSPKRTIQVVLTTTAGNGTGTLIVEVSNDNSNFITLGTTTFTSAASPQTDGYAIDAAWAWIRSRCTAITGTGASIEVRMGQ